MLTSCPALPTPPVLAWLASRCPVLHLLSRLCWHAGAPVQRREHVVAQLALQSSSAARLQRHTHLNTLNMSSMEEEASSSTEEQARAALPLSQLAFKVRGGGEKLGNFLLLAVEIVLLACGAVGDAGDLVRLVAGVARSLADQFPSIQPAGPVILVCIYRGCCVEHLQANQPYRRPLSHNSLATLLHAMNLDPRRGQSVTHRLFLTGWCWGSACPALQALLRASLAAARLHHGFLTTPHLVLGLVSAGSASLAQPAADSSSSSASLAAAAEAAVVRVIDGPAVGPDQLVVRGAAAAASMLGRSCGLDVVQWVPQLSTPAKAVLMAADELRQSQGGCRG